MLRAAISNQLLNTNAIPLQRQHSLKINKINYARADWLEASSIRKHRYFFSERLFVKEIETSFPFFH